jgi:hypothetical protein
MFSETETDKPSSNLMCNKMKCISTERYQAWSMSVSCVCVIPTLYQDPNSDWLQWSHNVGNSSIEAQHWHHSVDKKQPFLHVEVEVVFVVSFAKISMSNKKWGMAHPFFSLKAAFEKFATFWFWTGGCQEHIMLVWTEFKRRSSQVKKWALFNHVLATEWKFLLNTKFKSN